MPYRCTRWSPRLGDSLGTHQPRTKKADKNWAFPHISKVSYVLRTTRIRTPQIQAGGSFSSPERQRRRGRGRGSAHISREWTPGERVSLNSTLTNLPPSMISVSHQPSSFQTVTVRHDTSPQKRSSFHRRQGVKTPNHFRPRIRHLLSHDIKPEPSPR